MKSPLGVEPEATATVFKSGKINVVGGRSEPEARAVSRQFARRIQKMSWKWPEVLAEKNTSVNFNNFRIHNVFASVALPFDVKLREFVNSRKEDSRPDHIISRLFHVPQWPWPPSQESNTTHNIARATCLLLLGLYRTRYIAAIILLLH